MGSKGLEENIKTSKFDFEAVKTITSILWEKLASDQNYADSLNILILGYVSAPKKAKKKKKNKYEKKLEALATEPSIS